MIERTEEGGRVTLHCHRCGQIINFSGELQGVGYDLEADWTQEHETCGLAFTQDVVTGIARSLDTGNYLATVDESGNILLPLKVSGHLLNRYRDKLIPCRSVKLMTNEDGSFSLVIVGE